MCNTQVENYCSDDEDLRDLLKRCPQGTVEALCRYRSNPNEADLSVFLRGCIERFTEKEYRHLLKSENPSVSFVDDLGIDSMTMMEIVILVEECLKVQIDNSELLDIRVLGDMNEFLSKKLSGSE